jgi:ribosome-associated heat shock protein Hsp15
MAEHYGIYCSANDRGMTVTVECRKMTDQGETSRDVRLDVWLDVSCLYRTRSEAQKACKSGKVIVNGQPARQNRSVRSGDEIELSRPLGRKQLLRVLQLADRHIAKANARTLYEDLTPAPTAEEIEMRRMERMFRAATPKKSPDKRDRHALRRLRGRE